LCNHAFFALAGRVVIKNGDHAACELPLSLVLRHGVIIPARDNAHVAVRIDGIGVEIRRRSRRVAGDDEQRFIEFVPSVAELTGTRLVELRIPGLNGISTTVLLATFERNGKRRLTME